jgi:predicted small metal-binding protein
MNTYTQSTEDQQANHGKLTFRCSDLEVKDCKWQTSGNSEKEVMRLVEEHLHEGHGFAFDVATQILVRRAIRRQVA